MRKGVSEAIIFTAGLLVGGISSFIVCKLHYQKKAEEEIASVEKAFTDRINEIEDEKAEALGVASKAIINANEYNKNDPGSRDALSGKSTLLEGMTKIRDSSDQDYTKYYEKNSKETIEVDDHPRDDEPDSDVCDSDEKYDGTSPIVELSERVKSPEPYEISGSEYGAMPGWDFKEFYYYQGDGVMVESDDGCEEIIDNYEYLLGNCIEKSGFDKNEVMTIYVRNEDLHMDYEIMKVRGKYAE